MTDRVVVLASGDGSTFEAIVKACKEAKIVALICDVPGAKVLKRAYKLGIQSRVIARVLGEKREDYDKRLAVVVGGFAPDLVVLAGFMRILTEEFLSKFEKTTNIHPSLLPKFKGLHTYSRALAEGESVHGTSVHEVIVDLDAGPILAQRTVPILPDDTEDTLQQRTQTEERDLYPKIIDLVVSGKIGFATKYGKR